MIHATIEQLTEVANLRPNQVKALKVFQEKKRIEKLRIKQINLILDALENQIIVSENTPAK
jgi:hypothetical protein